MTRRDSAACRDEADRARRMAGYCAILAALCWPAWFAWAACAPAASRIIGSERASRIDSLLMAGWNLLLVPLALHLYHTLRSRAAERVAVYTACGVLSHAFWAFASASHSNSSTVEICYVLLSSVWWIGMGSLICSNNRLLGITTVALGGFALLDGMFGLFEPTPPWIYAMAGPKLPLSILWDFWMGAAVLASGLNPIPAPASVDSGDPNP